MAGVYKTKQKEEVDTKGFEKCYQCKRDAKPLFRSHTMSTKVFCSEGCIGQYFNGAMTNYNSFKIA